MTLFAIDQNVIMLSLTIVSLFSPLAFFHFLENMRHSFFRSIPSYRYHLKGNLYSERKGKEEGNEGKCKRSGCLGNMYSSVEDGCIILLCWETRLQTQTAYPCACISMSENEPSEITEI